MTEHSSCGTRLYKIWQAMRQRVKQGTRPVYKNIYVCQEWENFSTFKQWAINNGYAENLTIERIDNTDGYRPENCTWITHDKQVENRSSNIMCEYKGKMITASEKARLLGLKPCIVFNRKCKGWPEHRWFSPLS